MVLLYTPIVVHKYVFLDTVCNIQPRQRSVKTDACIVKPKLMKVNDGGLMLTTRTDLDYLIVIYSYNVVVVVYNEWWFKEVISTDISSPYFVSVHVQTYNTYIQRI